MEDNPICRICMAANARYISIVDIHGFNEPALHEMISECTRYKVELNDVLPRKVCLKCAEDVRTAYRFKKRAEDSYKELCFLYHKEVKDTNVTCEIATQTNSNIFSCELCRSKFYDPSVHQDVLRNLNSHLKQDHPDQYKALNLKCQICEKRFSQRDHLVRHMRVHKAVPTSLSYGVALEANTDIQLDSVAVINEAEWDTHFEHHDVGIENVSKDLQVDQGEEEFDKDYSNERVTWLENPENIVIKVDVPNYESDDDDEEASAHTEQNGDIETMNNVSNDHDISKKKPVHRCQICQRDFLRLDHLRRHALSAHTDERPYACSLCDKRFKRSDNLKKHILGVHQFKTHECKKCNKEFPTHSAVLSHIATRHTDETIIKKKYTKVHECEKCKKKYTSKYYLKVHQRLHAERIFSCRFCKITFKDRKEKRKHESQHKSISPY